MKGTNFFVLLFAVCLVQLASAKEVDKNNTISKRGTYQTNKFFNNFFIGVAGGVNMYEGADDNAFGIEKRLAPAIDAYVGKWFTPTIGGRIAYSGLYANGWCFTKSNMTNNEPIDGYYKEEFSTMHFHADFMWNISNTIGGYNPGRFWDFIPYLGVGYMHLKSRYGDNTGDEVTASVGLYNTLKISRSIDITLDIRQTVLNPRSVDPLDDSKFNYMTTGSLGLAFKIGNNRFKRVGNTDASYYSSQISDLKEAYSRAESKAVQLELDLNSEKLRVKGAIDSIAALPPKVIVNESPSVVAVVPIALFFEVGKSDLGAKEIVNLNFYVENAIKTNPNRVFTITGLIDNSSGKRENNKILAEKRVQYIYDMLIIEYGIKPRQLIKEGVVKADIYPDSRLNRVVIIK